MILTTKSKDALDITTGPQSKIFVETQDRHHIDAVNLLASTSALDVRIAKKRIEQDQQEI